MIVTYGICVIVFPSHFLTGTLNEWASPLAPPLTACHAVTFDPPEKSGVAMAGQVVDK